MCVGGVSVRFGNQTFTVDAYIDTVFPTVVLSPVDNPKSFCSFTLKTIFESESRQNFYDPRVDYDLADSRIQFSRLGWDVRSAGDGLVVFSATGDERFSTLDIQLDMTDAENVTSTTVALDGYEFLSETAVLVFEWEVMAGYTYNDTELYRKRRIIRAGGCLYNATENAFDDGEQSVRCEVRTEKSVNGERFASIYQSYAHFSGNLRHENLQLQAESRNITNEEISPGNRKNLTFSILSMMAMVVILISA